MFDAIESTKLSKSKSTPQSLKIQPRDSTTQIAVINPFVNKAEIASKNIQFETNSENSSDMSYISMNHCLDLINKSSQDNNRKAINFETEKIKKETMKKGKLKKISFVNDSVAMNILLGAEQIFIKYFKVFYSNLNVSRKHPVNELTFDYCKFLLDTHLKQRPRNYSSSDPCTQSRFEYDQKSRWLLLMSFCFMATNLLFNASWRLFVELTEDLEAKFGKIISSKYFQS